ncbi:MAG: hypothetical protein JWO98_4725 [Frankiales bacterium]|nr:hypothetical protein [Frankiales bacterium]
MAHAWLILQILSVVFVVAGVFLLLGVAWALIVAGVLGAVIGEMKS